MSSIIKSISISPAIVGDIEKRQKQNPDGWGWSYIFKVGYMRLTSDTLGDFETREQQNEKIEKLSKKLDYYVKRVQELELKQSEEK